MYICINSLDPFWCSLNNFLFARHSVVCHRIYDLWFLWNSPKSILFCRQTSNWTSSRCYAFRNDETIFMTLLYYAEDNITHSLHVMQSERSENDEITVQTEYRGINKRNGMKRKKDCAVALCNAIPITQQISCRCFLFAFFFLKNFLGCFFYTLLSLSLSSNLTSQCLSSFFFFFLWKSYENGS